MSYAATLTWWIEGGRHYTRQGFLEHAKDFQQASSTSLHGRHVAITGANAGLGFALAKEMAKRNATVHLLCRNRERGEKAIQSIMDEHPDADARLHIVDVSSASNVQEFVKTFTTEEGGGHKLQVLVNNAGVVPEKLIHTPEGNEISMATAMGGSFLLTSLLQVSLKTGRQRICV